MRYVLLGFLVCSLGCQSAALKAYQADPALREAGKQLVDDFLKGQQNGESAYEAKEKYGVSVHFYGVEEYRFLTHGQFWNDPAILYHIRAANSMGAVIWNDFWFLFEYDPELRTAGHKYLGLKVWLIIP